MDKKEVQQLIDNVTAALKKVDLTQVQKNQILEKCNKKLLNLKKEIWG